MYFDTHAHLNFAAYKDDADEVIKRTLAQGVSVINVGSQYSTSQRAVEMAEKYPDNIFAAVGLHPIHLVKRTVDPDDSELTDNDFETTGESFNYEKYKKLAQHPKVVAVGEMGLDYHHFEMDDNVEDLKKKQKETFLQGIKLANELKKPIIIHCWGVKSRKEFDHARTDAYDDLYEILKNNPVEKRGVIHSFVGGYKTARKFTEPGYKIGLNGIITYSPDYSRLIKELNFEDILVETDCPYLAPVPHKGEKNEPLYVQYVAEKIAEVKEKSLKEISEITTQNAKSVFKF